MEKHVIVTGASGFLGSNLALHCAEQGYKVWGSYLSKPFQLKGVEARKLDVCVPDAIESLMAEARPAYVFHCAAISQPDQAAKDVAATRQINVQGPKLLAEACARHGSKMIFTSTDLVFDGSVKFVTEKDAPHPLGVYAKSKLDAEAAILALPQARAAVVRTVLMYGWGKATGRSFAENWLRSFLTSNPIRAFTDQFRCPIWVGDLCQALLGIAEKDLQGIFHAAGPERMSRHEFARKLAVEFALNPDLAIPSSMLDHIFDDPRPMEASLNIDKLKSLIGFAPLGVDEGLKIMHDKLRAQL
jgi:dTDP-4-dehydrorhamnose reductase